MGKAIIIPDVDWSSRNFGKVTIITLYISGSTTIPPSSTNTYTAMLGGSEVNATWSIVGDGTISSTTGTSVTVTTGPSEGNITLSVTYGGYTSSLSIAVAVPYVTDGLLYRFVGSDATTSSWVDRINDLTLTMNGVTKTQDGKGVVFDGSSYGVAEDSAINMQNCTIELVYANTSDTGNVVIIAIPSTTPSTLNGWMYMHTSDKFCVRYGGLSTGTPFLNGVFSTDKVRVHSVGGNTGTASTFTYVNYVNKTAYTNNGTTPQNFYSYDSNIYVGCRYSGGLTNYFTGTLYEIRVYNRKLTSEEVLQNQTYDMSIYNITD